MQYLLSLVVPVYNVEKYLKPCLDSMIRQDFDSSCEILLIDDGSTDGSGNICDEYSQKYEIFSVFHKTNGGLSDARNYGLKRAKGEYVHFVDSDDILRDDYATIILKEIRLVSPDLIHINFERFVDKISGKVELNSEEPGNRNLDSEELLSLLFKREIENYTWSFILKRSNLIQNDFEFPIYRNYEDIATSYFLIYISKKALEISIPLYLYRERAGSIATVADVKNVHDVEVSLDEIENFFKNKDSVAFNYYFNNYKLAFLLFIFYENFLSRSINRRNYKKNLKEIKKRMKSCIDIHSKIKSKYLIGYLLILMHLFLPIQEIRRKLARKL